MRARVALTLIMLPLKSTNVWKYTSHSLLQLAIKTLFMSASVYLYCQINQRQKNEYSCNVIKVYNTMEQMRTGTGCQPNEAVENERTDDIKPTWCFLFDPCVAMPCSRFFSCMEVEDRSTSIPFLLSVNRFEYFSNNAQTL